MACCCHGQKKPHEYLLKHSLVCVPMFEEDLELPTDDEVVFDLFAGVAGVGDVVAVFDVVCLAIFVAFFGVAAAACFDVVVVCFSAGF